MAIHSNGQTILGSTHIEGNTLGTCGEVDEVAGGASGMDLDRIVELGDRDMKERLLGCTGQVLHWGL
jgi:hypothetical protein